MRCSKAKSFSLTGREESRYFLSDATVALTRCVSKGEWAGCGGMSRACLAAMVGSILGVMVKNERAQFSTIYFQGVAVGKTARESHSHSRMCAA